MAKFVLKIRADAMSNISYGFKRDVDVTDLFDEEDLERSVEDLLDDDGNRYAMEYEAEQTARDDVEISWELVKVED